MVLAVLTFPVALARADIQPAHLVAGPIAWDGRFAIGEVYAGGTYGQTVKGGRTAFLELQEPGKGWSTLTSVVLPDIGPKSYYVTGVLAGPRKQATTIRLRITPASAQPQYDVSSRTFPGSLDNLTAVKASTHPGLDKAMVKTPLGTGQWQKAPYVTDFDKYLLKKLP
jgi:hypothetical protein